MGKRSSQFCVKVIRINVVSISVTLSKTIIGCKLGKRACEKKGQPNKAHMIEE